MIKYLWSNQSPIDDVDDQWMKSSHVATSNEESHMAALEEKTYMESSY